MGASQGGFRLIRLILLGVELAFSLVVLITAAVWINALPLDNVNFALFVGLTSFLICIFFIFVSLKSEKDRVLVLIQLILLVLYWIFWLSAAAATAATVQTVNSSWNFSNNYDCDYAGVYLNWSGANGWCKASKRKGAVRACCAFSWLTWALWTASLALFVIEDVIKDKALNSKPKAANGTASAGTAEPVVAKTSPVPNAPPAVEKV